MAGNRGSILSSGNGVNPNDYPSGLTENLGQLPGSEPTGILGVLDGVINWLLWGDESASKNAIDEFSGYNSEMRGYAQQEHILDREQEFADERNRMERMIQAGINPNLAAAGISGAAASPSAPAAANASGAPAAALSAASGLVGTLAQNHLAKSEATLNNANAAEVAKNAESLRQLQAAELRHNLASAGLDDVTAAGIVIDNRYKEPLLQQELWIKMQNFKNMQAEWQTIQDEHELNMKHLQWYDEEMRTSLDLMSKQALNQAKQAEEAKENARYQKRVNDFWTVNKFDPNSSTDNALRQLFVDNPEMYQKVLSILQDAAYSQSYGSLNAEAQFAFTLENARRNGQNVSDMVYGRFGNFYDYLGRTPAHLENFVKQAIDKIKSVPDNKKGRVIREELNMILNNAYEQMELYPDDPSYAKTIQEITLALSLSNKELIEWYNKANQ